MALLHARDAAEAKVAAIGTVNPRPPGFKNDLIQRFKRFVARALDWHVREQVEFNRATMACVQATLEALTDVSRGLSALSASQEDLLAKFQDLEHWRSGFEQWRAGFESLFMSTVKLIRLCLPGMRERKWGRIMTVTSVTAREPLDGLTISNAIRPGLHGLLNSLSREVGKDGITVNALMPGSTLTDRLKDFPFDPEEIDRTIPARRLGKPEDFGAVAAFLASEQAGYINGEAIAVDGGMLRSI